MLSLNFPISYFFQALTIITPYSSTVCIGIATGGIASFHVRCQVSLCSNDINVQPPPYTRNYDTIYHVHYIIYTCRGNIHINYTCTFHLTHSTFTAIYTVMYNVLSTHANIYMYTHVQGVHLHACACICAVHTCTCIHTCVRYIQCTHYMGTLPSHWTGPLQKPKVHIHENHNSLGCEQPPGLDVNQSLNAQDTFQPMPGLISCARVWALHVMHTQHR